MGNLITWYRFVGTWLLEKLNFLGDFMFFFIEYVSDFINKDAGVFEDLTKDKALTASWPVSVPVSFILLLLITAIFALLSLIILPFDLLFRLIFWIMSEFNRSFEETNE